MQETIKQRVSVEQAAKELGCSPQEVRLNMQDGTWELGEVIPPVKGKKRWKYYVYREKLDLHLGKKQPQQNIMVVIAGKEMEVQGGEWLQNLLASAQAPDVIRTELLQN